MSKRIKPELLSPAGSWSSLRAAVEAGADSVYFGIKGINMRHLASNFDVLQIKKVMAYLHQHKKKGYLTLNTIILNKDLPLVKKILTEAKKAKVDAIILWDMAVLELAKKMKLKIHLSTQASVSNVEAIKKYVNLGVKRFVLARECTLADIKQIIGQIKRRKIKCEIETFIHGAMCVSISGRCFLSHYSFGKSANQGQCLQPCRRKYFIKDLDNETEYVLGEDYILSPKDLCSIDFLEDLIASGINSFKIEGRMRAPEYVRVVTSVYRRAIDAYANKTMDNSLKKKLRLELSAVYNRGFSSGFYFGIPKDAISSRLEHTHEKIYVGQVTRYFKKISVAEIKLLSGALKNNDKILFIGKSTPAEVTKVTQMQHNNEFVKKAGKGDIIGVKLPFVVKPKDKVFIWKKK